MSEIIFEIEEKRREIQKSLSLPLSCYKKLTLLSNFFALLLSANNKNILKAYGTCLIAPFSNYLAACDIACVPPVKHSRIIQTAEALLASHAFPDGEEALQRWTTLFKIKMELLTDILNGKDDILHQRNKYFFPLIDTSNYSSDLYGMLDTITVKIVKGKEQVFHLIPSEKEIEARIKTQIETSWNVAVAYAKKYIKHISPYHEVIVSFDKRVGFYVGDSLGVALTLAYINELFLFYNAPLTITAKEGGCFTGSLLQKGEIPSIGEENITKKVELVFYSNVKTFVLPKENEPAAEKKLHELKKEYPNRNLKLIAVTDIEDLLSRRNVVDIKKLSILKRAGKTVVRNKVVTVLLFVLIGILSLVYFYEYDDNPYGFEVTSTGYNLVNQSGRVLWTINCQVPDTHLINPIIYDTYIRVLDINDDKKNEVMCCFGPYDPLVEEYDIRNCATVFDYKGRLSNKFSFTKSVYSKRENLLPPYGMMLLDTLTYKGVKSVIVVSGNSYSYPNAAYILNLKTQKIISDTLWNCGHIQDMRVVDLNNDGRKEVIGIAINNGYERTSLFLIEISKFGGQIPSIDEYKLINVNQADVGQLFLFPKSDYTTFFNQRNAGLRKRSLIVNDFDKVVAFYETQLTLDKNESICYSWDYLRDDFLVQIDNSFRVNRDSLVAQGKLQKPFTDTWEYRQLIHDQILKWNGKDFEPIKK